MAAGKESPLPVRIESSDGVAWNSRITVEGVDIPCTKIKWEADASGGFTTCQLEVPRVAFEGHAREVVIKYREPSDHVTWHWWRCACGASMQSTTARHAASSFENRDNHSVDCTEDLKK